MSQPRITLLRTPGPAPRVLRIDAEDDVLEDGGQPATIVLGSLEAA